MKFTPSLNIAEDQTPGLLSSCQQSYPCPPLTQYKQNIYKWYLLHSCIGTISLSQQAFEHLCHVPKFNQIVWFMCVLGEGGMTSNFFYE